MPRHSRHFRLPIHTVPSLPVIPEYKPSPPPSYDTKSQGSDSTYFPHLPIAEKGGKTGEVVGITQKFTDPILRRTGGWKWLCVIIVCLLLILQGIVVGLVVGLRARNSSSASDTSNSDQPSIQDSATPPFPLGAWSFYSFLASISPLCLPASQSSLFRCYPYQTYTPQSPPLVFNWVISPASLSRTLTQKQNTRYNSYEYFDNTTLVISSNSNPFSISFPNSTLTLMAPGTDDERYQFTTLPYDKLALVPAPNSTAGDVWRCHFDAAITGSLYTRRENAYGSEGPGVWWGAVEVVEQTRGLRACYRTKEGSGEDGDEVEDVESFKNGAKGQGECVCDYRNWGQES